MSTEPMRTENDIRAALATLVPDPATDALLLTEVQRKISVRRTVRRMTGVAALAAGAAAAVVIGMVAPGGKHLSPANRHPIVGAAAALRTLAKTAVVQPAFHPPGPGQYWYFATRQFGGLCFMLTKPKEPINPNQGYGYYANCYIRVLSLQQTQTWIAPNGSGRVLTTTIKTAFASARDRAHWIAAGRPKLDNAPTDLRFGPHKLHIGETGLGKLPTNPARLATVIKSRRFEGGPPGPAEDFAQVADLLRDMNAPPALRAAAFEVGARIPRVKSLGVVSFHGVRGLGIVIGHPVPRQPRERGVNELIFNRTTSRLKAEVAMTVKSGKVIDITWVTYRSSGLVNSTTSTP